MSDGCLAERNASVICRDRVVKQRVKPTLPNLLDGHAEEQPVLETAA